MDDAERFAGNFISLGMGIVQGARGTRLATRVASHTPWIGTAAERFARYLAGVAFAPPGAALVCNHTTSVVRAPAELELALSRQIASPIHWDACMDAVAERGTSCVLEVGPGTTLAGLWRTRHPHVPARSLDDFRSPGAVVAWVERTLRQLR